MPSLNDTEPRVTGWLRDRHMQEINLPRYSHIVGNLWVGGHPIYEAPDDAKFIVDLYGAAQYNCRRHQILLAAPFDDGNQIPDSLPHLVSIVSSFLDAGPTLIHCQAGINRSCLVAAAALMKGGMAAEDAVALLRVRRDPIVLSNVDFTRYLAGSPRFPGSLHWG